MSDATRLMPEGFERGPVQGANLIGEVTEALHRWLLDGFQAQGIAPPRIEEDLSFVPKDREEVVYVYMYRVARNESLMNVKKWRASTLSRATSNEIDEDLLFERPPLFLHLYYLLSVHSRFRSEAERLMGFTLMRLNEATHLVYRPRRYQLPDGKTLDSAGRPWSADAEGDVEMEKVSLALVDDLTVGDAINFFTINEAPYRPFVTYRAMCAMRGSMVAGPPTRVTTRPAHPWMAKPPPTTRPSGRMPQGVSGGGPASEEVPESPGMPQIGPEGFGHRTLDEPSDSED
ncbi:MAG: DUF4255 domain-containing protein [Myxococcales bacterium]|nr:DUF4255 domain-containing protein [Myxococcales bacterium]